MTRFSERYGYVKPSDVIIREDMPLSVQNAICTCFDELPNFFLRFSYGVYSGEVEYRKLEKYLWTYFFNNREKNFSLVKNRIVATSFLESNNQWYKKLDLVESTIQYLFKREEQYSTHPPVLNAFIELLNSHFERLHFAYRVVDKQIVEITSKEEIVSIETALQDSTDNIRMHLSKALELYAKRPNGDYSNSIKESISAVEAFCRAKTGENSLGKALNRLEKDNIIFPNVLKTAFDKLYTYTNQEKTGIRHALMDSKGEYIPSEDEALFMLVSCSAFINYLGKKIK